MNTDIESSSRDVTEELCDLIDRSLKVLKRSEAFYFILMKVGVLFFWCKFTGADEEEEDDDRASACTH